MLAIGLLTVIAVRRSFDGIAIGLILIAYGTILFFVPGWTYTGVGGSATLFLALSMILISYRQALHRYLSGVLARQAWKEWWHVLGR